MSMRFRQLAEAEGLPVADHQMYARDFARLECTEDRTKQADKDSCDINNIVRRNLESGMLPQTRQVPVYMDVSEVGSLQEAMDVVVRASEFFMGLPSRTREAFRNDPALFAAAASDPRHADLFRSLGLTPAIEAPPSSGGASGTVPT